jgi:XTP/dITP diphosphohydrolase
VSRRAPSAQPPTHRRLEGRIVIATHNSGKLKELRELLLPYGIEAVSAGELGLAEPEESGTSFRANARIKAQAAAVAAKLPAFADDSGLVVEALDGAPGIHSARWAGENKDFAGAMQKIENLLRERNITDRRAHFVSALCVAWPDGHVEEFEGRVDGTVVWPPRGTAGFGYDPIFLPDGHTRTFGEMNAEEKHGLPPARNQAEWEAVSRPDCAPVDKVGARLNAKPESTFGYRAPGKGLSHRARAFLKLASACLQPIADD